MNFGNIIRYGLNKAELPPDALHLEMARFEGNFIVQEVWYATKADIRQSRGTLQTISGADEYILPKYFDAFVKNTFQGPLAYPVQLTYLTTEEFFRKISINSGTAGNQLIYTYGDTVGFDAQLLNASKIVAFSGLASKTVGTVNVFAGSDIVTSGTDIFSFNDTGLRFKKNGDAKTYKIGKVIGPRQIQLTEKYRGTSENGAAYFIGDIGIRVNITAFVSGQIQSFEIQLDGSTHISSDITANTLMSISKSDKTGGNITIQDVSGNTLGTLAPGETEIERKTVLLWPKPNAVNAMTFRFFMDHPLLWLDSDRLLLPKKFHNLIAYRLAIRLLEQSNKPVPQELAASALKLTNQFENDAEDCSLMDCVPDGAERRFGESYYYDKIDSEFL